METLFFDRRIGFEADAKEKSLLISVLESITDGFFFVNNDWNVLYWNKAAEVIMNVEASQVVGRNIWDEFTHARETEIYTQYHKSKKENVSIEFDIYYLPNDLWFQIKTYPFEEGLAVCFKDVTFKRKVAEEIENTRRQQEAIVNASPDAIWSVDAECRLLTANDVYKKRALMATGINLKPGDYICNVYPVAEVKKRRALYERALTGERFTIEEKFTFPNSPEVIFLEISFNPVFNTNGLVTGVACFAKDITERKQHVDIIEETNLILAEREQSLHEVKLELEAVLNSSLDLICSIDLEGYLVHVNDAFKHLLGYEPKELKGRHFTEILHPDDIAKTIELGNQVLNGAIVTTFRNRMIKKSGKELYVMWSARFDRTKQITFSVGRDASNLVQAELLKEHSERRFSVLIEKGADMIAILDEKLDYKYISPNIESISGYSIKKYIKLNPLEIIHPEDSPIVQKLLGSLLARGEGAVEKGSYRIKDGNGNWRWLETIVTNLLTDPAVEGIVINSRDITERRLHNEELKITNERFQTVLNVTNEVIWEWDLATDKVFKNANHQTIFGYKQEGKDTGKTWVNKIHKDDMTRVKESIWKTIETCDTCPWQQEYRYYRANGEIAYVIDRGVLIKDGEGKPVRMVGSMQDVTERKRIENERELIIEELTKSNNDLKQFSFIISHNLRAPLSNVLGLLNIIHYPDLDVINRTTFDLLNQSALQLKSTIDDLTNIIVIRSTANVGAEAVNIEQTFEEVKDVYLNALHDIAFELKTDFKLREATLNKAYLLSIFINLVSNAIKYRSYARVLKIEVATEEVDGVCTLTFSDNGSGLDTVRLKDRLFGMYQRFHDAGEGKGLGLFIVKSQVTAMGGSIKMESEIDKGTTFTITLPIKNLR